MSKRNAKHVVQSEVILLMTAMKRRMKGNTIRTFQEEMSDSLYSNLSLLKDTLSRINDLSEIQPLEYLSPFLDVISSAEMIGMITGLALTSVEKFLSFRYVDISITNDGLSLQVAIEAVANTVTNTKFVGTDHSSDEVILTKILRLLDTLMHSPAGYLISDYAVCKIISSCFRICFEPQLSELLRHIAECTLERIVHLLFTRLPELKEDVRCRKKNLTINMDLSTLNPKTRLRRKVQVSSSNHSEQSQPQEPVTTNEDNCSINSATNDESEEHQTDVETASIETPGHISIMIDATDDGVDAKNEADHDAEPEGCVVFDLARNESSTNINSDVVASVETSSQKTEKIQYKTEKGIVFKSDLNSSDNASDIESVTGDARNPRYEQPQPKSKLNSTTTIPYGLACVQKLLSNLIAILSPDNITNIHHVRTGLTLITAALESGAEYIASAPNNLLVLMQNELSKNLISLLQSERLSFFAASVRVCFLLFESMRPYLKFQLEMYLSRLISIIMSEGDSVPHEYREVALESIVQLWRIPGFITELYLNYDCDIYCSDLLQDLAELFSKIATPDRVNRCLMTTQVIALEALLFMIDTIYVSKDDPNRALYGDHETGGTELIANAMNPILRRKMNQKIGTEKFNSNVKEGLNYLKEHGFCQSNAELAKFFRENPRLNKKVIGEYISTRSNKDALKEYIRLFDSRGVRIDATLRMFLEEFRLPGESANIEIVLETMAESVHENNPGLFSEASAIYVLFIAIVMLNVDQHNPNSKKQQTPMTVEQFKRNLKGPKKAGEPDANDDAETKYTGYIGNIDEESLNKIYENIKNEEIVMPQEQKGAIKENYLWKQLLRRASTSAAQYHCTDLKNHSYELFNLVWKSAVNAFVYIFEGEITTGLYQCASIAAHYNLCEIMDKIIIYISKFTNYSSPQDTIVAFGKNEKTKLAARVMFQIAQKHADILRDGWKNILDCLISLFKARLMPKSLTEVEDFISKDKIILLIEEEKSLTRTEAPSMMNWLYSLTSSDYSTGQRNQEDEIMKNDALKIVNECSITQLIEDTRFLKEASLTELINALINGTRIADDSHAKTMHHRPSSKNNNAQTITGYESNLWVDWRDEHSRVFCLELMMKVLLHNSDRIGSFLPLIHDHFYTVLIGSVRPDFLLERTVVACLRLAIQLLRKQGDVTQVFTCLEILVLTRMNVLRHVKLHIVCGLNDLIHMHAANIPSEKDWKLILTLLEICGAGTKLDPIYKAEIVSRLRTKEIASVKKLTHGHSAVLQHSEQNLSLSTSVEYESMGHELYNSTDDLHGQSSECNYDQHSDTGETCRGYTSDSELYKSSSPQQDLADKWVITSHNDTAAENGSPTQSDNVRLYSECPLPPVNQYNIILTNVHFSFKDPLAIEKACEILSYLVRDPAHITPINFEACVHTLRVFAEACVKCSFTKKAHLRENRNSHQHGSSNPDGSADSNSVRRGRSIHSGTVKKSTKAVSRATEQQQHPSDLESDTEAPFKISAQLLDLMCTLHDRAAKIYLEWSKTEVKDADRFRQIYANLWRNCWCPLLQGMARLCCDVRPEVRVIAMTFLQRALLSPVLSHLNGSQWEDCFTKVLFPLLSCFLESMRAQCDDSVRSTSQTEISDPRMRAIQILTKVFLQHLGPLHELSTFTALWLTILEYMDSYMRANNKSDSLDDAVRESLKNVLLVMHTGTQDRAILVRSNDEDGQLLKLTCDRLSTFLPDLVEELFGVEPAPEPSVPPCAHEPPVDPQVSAESPPLSPPS